jgi:hypothetical protein
MPVPREPQRNTNGGELFSCSACSLLLMFEPTSNNFHALTFFIDSAFNAVTILSTAIDFVQINSGIHHRQQKKTSLN